MPSKTITVTNGDGSTRTITIPDRSRFAGVRTINRQTPFSESTLRMQLTYSGHADLSGVYERTSTSSTSWSQVDGYGNFERSLVDIPDPEVNSEGTVEWQIYDGSDNNPSDTFTDNVSVSYELPWKRLSFFAANGITLTPVTETLTVNRTAPVITSDRKGESRPLLSKLVGGAAAAYSLRDLNDKAGNNKVVEVFRSSDNKDRTFLAKEVSNGTLEAWVNEDAGITFGNATAVQGCTITDASSTGFTYTASGTGLAGARVSLNRIIPTGATINLTLTTTKSFGMTPTLRLARGSAFTNAGDPINIANSTAGTQTLSVKATAPATSFVFFDNAVGTFTISDFKINSIVYDGYVSKWYDQSGNGNHAIQPTYGNQPKIVEAGNLLNELDFDGTDDKLTIDFGADLSQANSFFMVHQSDTTTGASNEFFDTAGGNPRTLLDQSGNDYRMFTNASAGTGVAVTTDKSLIFALYNGTSSLFAKNGTATSSLNAGTLGIRQNSILGASGARFYDGTIQEFIIYNSDQSANRLAIEANINNQYDIY